MGLPLCDASLPRVPMFAPLPNGTAPPDKLYAWELSSHTWSKVQHRCCNGWRPTNLGGWGGSGATQGLVPFRMREVEPRASNGTNRTCLRRVKTNTVLDCQTQRRARWRVVIATMGHQ